MAIYYVDGSVGSSGDGSSGSPFKTLLDAQPAATAGNTIYIRPGTYAAGDAMNNNWTADLGGGTRATGTSGARITWARDPDTTTSAADVVINGAIRKEGFGSIVSYVTFEGLTINGGIMWYGLSTSQRFTGLHVKGCDISGGCVLTDDTTGVDVSNAATVFLSDAIDCLIQDCTLHDVDVWNQLTGINERHGGSCVKYYRARGTILEHCYLYNWRYQNNERAYNAKEGCEDSTIRRCLFRISAGASEVWATDWCIQADASNNQWDDGHEVYENIFIISSTGQNSAAHYIRNQAANTNIYNNTYYGCGIVHAASQSLGDNPDSALTNFAYYNNISVCPNSNQFFYSFSRRENFEPTYSDYNIFSGAAGFIENRDDASVVNHGNSLAAWVAHHGTDYDAHSITTAPTFVSTTGGSEDFHLQAGSAGEDAGRNGSGEDMGAYPRGDDGTVIGPRSEAPAAPETVAPVRARRAGSRGKGKYV